jgi:hypothetical protein
MSAFVRVLLVLERIVVAVVVRAVQGGDLLHQTNHGLRFGNVPGGGEKEKKIGDVLLLGLIDV